MSSCDTAAYIWHSSITAFKLRRPDLVVPAQIGICSQARTSYLVFDTLLPWHVVTAACGTARNIVLSDGIHARLWLSTQNRAEFPRALVNVMSGTFTVVRGYCADLLLRPSGRGRRSRWEVYFCQPVISDPSNYTLINQVWRPDGCGPLQRQSLVIPHIHSFNFSPRARAFSSVQCHTLTDLGGLSKSITTCVSENNAGFNLIKHPRLEDKDELLSASWIPEFSPSYRSLVIPSSFNSPWFGFCLDVCGIRAKILNALISQAAVWV